MTKTEESIDHDHEVKLLLLNFLRLRMVKMIMMKVKKYEWQCVLADILVLAFWPFFLCIKGGFFPA